MAVSRHHYSRLLSICFLCHFALLYFGEESVSPSRDRQLQTHVHQLSHAKGKSPFPEFSNKHPKTDFPNSGPISIAGMM